MTRHRADGAYSNVRSEGRIRENTIAVERMLAAENCYLMNAVRGLHAISVHYEIVG